MSPNSSYSSQSALAKQQKTNQVVNKPKCPNFNKELNSKMQLSRNIEKEHEKVQQICQVCSKRIFRKDTLAAHTAELANTQFELEIGAACHNMEEVKCNMCFKSLFNSYMLTKHMKVTC